MISVNPKSKTPLYQQIFEQFREQILDGTYQAKSKLPPIRSLALELGVSRNTVETAYMHLCQEGYVTARSGSGFLVEDGGAPYAGGQFRHREASELFYRRLEQASIWEIPPEFERRSAPRKNTLDDIEVEFDFDFNNLQVGSFPSQVWRRLAYEIICGQDSHNLNNYGDKLGLRQLREQVAQLAKINSGVNCHPSQVIIQAGTQSALANFLTLLDPLRDVIAMEEPGFDGARSVFETARFKLFPIPVYKGADDLINELYNSHAKLAYVTPNAQFPTGISMQTAMRQQLLKWAAAENAYILEDDYCREFHYGTRPSACLQSIDRHNRVIYMGTFSKTIAPAIRLSYLILPPDLLFEWHKLFSEQSSEVPWLSQATLCSYIEKGYWNKHLRKMQGQYKRKHDLLVRAVQAHMGSEVEVFDGSKGLHIMLAVRDKRHQNELIKLGLQAGIKVYDTARYWVRDLRTMENYVMLGFSSINESKIEPGIERLAKAWFG